MNSEITITIWQAMIVLLSFGLTSLFSGAIIVLTAVYISRSNPSLLLAIQKLSESYPIQVNGEVKKINGTTS